MNLSIHKKIFIFLVALAIVFSPLETRPANAWEATEIAVLNNAITAIREQVTGLINGAAKQAAIQALTQSVETIINGAAGQGSKIITDWEQVIVHEPEVATALYLNDYLSQTTRGRGSAAGYVTNPFLNTKAFAMGYEGVGDGSFQYGLAMNDPAYGRLTRAAQASGISVNSLTNSADNYLQKLVSTAQQRIIDHPIPTVTYQGNPAQNLFAGGNLKNFNLYLSGINNPWSYQAGAEAAYATQLTDVKDATRTEKLTGGGFESEKSGGQVITPGSTIKDTWNNVQDLPNKIIANAKNLGEMAPALAGKLATSVINAGIGKIKSEINKTIVNTTNKINNSIQTQMQQYGPAAVLKNVR